MKTLYVVRHAKSSWGDLTTPDFDRPLSDRGQRNAPEMAQRLLSRGFRIDAFVTSTARRAMQTSLYFIKAYGRSPEELILREDLYHAPAEVYFSVVAQQDDKYSSIAIFGHNPGISAFVNELTTTRIDDMPTCAIFAVQADVRHWAEFPAAKKQFLFFDTPKQG
ncbi:SixA phosphatase family protein [Flavihumibacter fluvii]|uniref:SixA phosphatase family protein n=1 Tax=Flavihumibacter fluvii TaxID=2838157 RepID=UPI001BDEDE2A|nr:histidine phosphatase family protein [Flavihumibacter fluvii]ULQ51892.1 histidine phosphatase family protein [Flavihumibacter fluvii]